MAAACLAPHRQGVLSKLGSHPARPSLPARSGRVATALAAAAFLLALTGASAFGATTMAAACDGVNLRNSAGTSYAIKATVKTGTLVTVVATVSGGSWSATCAGKAVSGSSWYRISAVNGTSAATLYGTTYVYGAIGLFMAIPVPTAPPPTAAPTAAVPTAALPPPPGPTTLPSSITLYGRGYGHGVGLSQYGANGRAAAGQDYLTILGHYYQGTTTNLIPNSMVRVLVLSGWAATSTNPLRLYGLGGPWTFDGIATSFPADAQARLIPTVSGTTTTWRLTVTALDGTVLHDAASSGDLRMRPASSATILRLYSKPSTYDRFRGVLHIMAKTTVTVVNEVPMESYLQGVVPSEMPYTWSIAALRAQAVASRSYAAVRLHPATGAWDIYDDTRSQVYRGVLAEHSTTNNAISSTAGRVVWYAGGVANTLYHSAGGGATESNQFAFVSASGGLVSPAVAYLQGSSDRAPDGSAYDKASPYATWHTATYSLAQIQAWFAADSRTNVGTLVALDLTHRGVSGRLVSVILIGADGTTKTVSGGVFLSIFNAHRPSADAPMRDTLFDLAPIP
jgi:stage II sporulation protein D